MRLDGRSSERAGGSPVTVDGFFIDSQTLYVSRHTKPVRGIAPVRESSVVCMCVCVFVVHANIHIYMYSDSRWVSATPCRVPPLRRVCVYRCCFRTHTHTQHTGCEKHVASLHPLTPLRCSQYTAGAFLSLPRANPWSAAHSCCRCDSRTPGGLGCRESS
jgi:hypothetical protein